MKGPLQTVIRNLTDKLLSYSVQPRLFIQPKGEFLLSFDPFTRWGDHPELERMLIDVRQGRAMITYLYDADFTAAAPVPNVQLSQNALRILNAPTIPKQQEPVQKVEKKTDVAKKPELEGKRPQLEGVMPPGELPPDPDTKKPELGKTAHAEERLMRTAAENAGITDFPEDAPAGKKVEEMLDEHNLLKQPDAATDIEKEASTTKKGGRKKKEVVTL